MSTISEALDCVYSRVYKTCENKDCPYYVSVPLNNYSKHCDFQAISSDLADCLTEPPIPAKRGITSD